MKKEAEKPVHHSDLSNIAKNAGISGFGEIAFNVIGYATSIIMTRTVGPSIYGIFNLANIITWIAQIFSSAGLGEGVLRYVAYYRGKGDMPRVKGTIITGTIVSFSLSLLLSVFLYFFADFIAVRFFHETEVGWAIKVLIISLPFLTLGELWLKAIQSFQAIKYQVYIQKMIQPVIKLILIAFLFLIGMKLAGILIASIISIVFGFLLSLSYLNKIYPVFSKEPTPVFERKELILFSVPLSMTQLLGVLTYYIDSLMLGYFTTTAEVGVYTVVGRLAILIVLPLTAINTIFAPMISELYAKKEISKLSDLFKTVTKWIFVFSFPIFIIFSLFAEPILGIFGKGFAVGALALIILGGGEMINAGVGSVGFILMMTGRSKIVLFNSILFCALNFILNYMLIPVYGVVGAAAATGVSIALINLLRLAEIYYYLKIHPFKSDFFKPCIAGTLTFILIYIIIINLSLNSLFSAVLLSLLLIILYGIFMYLLKLGKEDEYIIKLIYQKLVDFKGNISVTKN